ncbi:NifU family protein [Kineosporia sp. A_224]|uniref:NifU family protein n=1 Tax=Kineosporia sp. A_224 TaxID=1962180 RepID=UPI000B4BAD5D|nr:NifU family protein [Kineosporia sp. A_224]
MTTTEERPDLDAAARRVDTMLERASLLDERSQQVALDLKAAVEEFHRDAIVRVVRKLKDDPRGKELLFELVDDPVVYALFVMHGIVRADPVTLANRALEDVRPYLESHGGGVELVGVELPVARVRLSGTCNGCSASSTTLREVVERALVAAVHGLHQVEVVPNDPEPTMVPLTSVGLRPGLESLRDTRSADMSGTSSDPGAPSVATGWTRGPELADVTDGKVTLWRVPGSPQDEPGVAVVRIGEQVSAYKDACVHLGYSLERGLIDPEGGILTCPWHGMKYQAMTGECISAVDRRLEVYPASVHGGTVWLRLGR